MTFFARPILDNTQFVQFTDSTLTLSGQTQIATTSGLTLIGDGGMYIPVIATGASNNFVLTYDSVQQAIVLKPATGGGTGVYDYTGLTTCAVGGLPVGQDLYDDEIKDIIHCMVSPTLDPALTNPSISSFTINPTTTTYEVGESPSIIGTTSFNPGAINPQYPPTACSCRSDGTQCYTYDYMGAPAQCVTNSPSNVFPFTPLPISEGNNIISSTVFYCSGTQPYDSSGAIYDSPLVAGCTSASQIDITGLYPWYWGIESSGGAASGVNRPTSDCIKSLITGGTTCKCVGNSNNTILVEFGSSSDDYLWFAIPVASTSKSVWYETALNNGIIGGAVSAGGNLFPIYDSENDICSSNPVWSGETYQIYVSNYQSASNTIMELRNL